MAPRTVLVARGADTDADIEAAFGARSDLDVRTVDGVDALYDALCYDTVSALVLPQTVAGTTGRDVARGVRGLYPDLPVLVAETEGELASDDGDGSLPDGVVTVGAPTVASDPVVDAAAAAVAGGVDSAAARPPSRLETLAMSAFDGFDSHLFAKDCDARHVLTSDTVVPTADVVGRTDEALDMVLESTRKAIDDDEHVMETREPVADREEYTDDEAGHVLTTKVPWYGADGSVVGLVGESKNIADRKERERELRRRNERLAKIATVAAHELRNELQVATGRLPEVGGDRQQQAVVTESLDRLKEIVDDVVKLATAERGGVEPERQWLSTPVRDVWETLPTEGADLRVVDDRLVDADPQAARLMFEILLSNAVEHGGADVTVTVGTTDDGFYVADDGPGIEFDRPQRVFDVRFAAAESDAGVGLYVARRIAGDHNWTLTARNCEGGGARFDVSL